MTRDPKPEPTIAELCKPLSAKDMPGARFSSGGHEMSDERARISQERSNAGRFGNIRRNQKGRRRKGGPQE